MKYSVIVIGDELLIGQVTDTYSGWIARYMAPWGWEATWVKVIADDAHEITCAIDEAFAASDVVLMTGGLGPTKDDITKPTLCSYFGGELVYDEATASQVEWVVSQRHLALNDYTRAQAMVPQSCRVIQNQVGTAPLMWFERDGKVLVSMPGVPFEMQTMMEREVVPQLLKHFHDNVHIAHRTFVVTGIIESLLAMRLDEFERALPPSMHLAYLPQPGLIRLRLNGTMNDAEALHDAMDLQSRRLHEILGKSIVSDQDEPLAQIVGNRLRALHLTLATAESCTGGNVAHQITAIAGSSDYYQGSVVSYANDVKTRLLDVEESVIAEHGVVSEPVVRQMVEGVCRLLNTDCAVATSGIAGPGGGTPQKPVGTVWMAAKCGSHVAAQMRHYPGERSRVITRATTDSLLLLLGLLE